MVNPNPHAYGKKSKKWFARYTFCGDKGGSLYVNF